MLTTLVAKGLALVGMKSRAGNVGRVGIVSDGGAVGIVRDEGMLGIAVEGFSFVCAVGSGYFGDDVSSDGVAFLDVSLAFVVGVVDVLRGATGTLLEGD